MEKMVRRGVWKTPMKRTLSVRYNIKTLSLRGNLLTLSCVGKRFRIVIDIPEYFRPMAESWRLKGATLKHSRGRFRLNLTYETDAPPKVAGRAIGVDVGSRNFAVTSDGDRHPSANPGVLRAVKRRYHHARGTLQAKGTRSAKRRLRATAGKEERFSRDMCHAVSKALANTPGVSMFVLEDLGGMRDRRRGRRANRVVHGLPFARIRFDLTYKAKALGKTVKVVEPAYTSQRCSKCGYTESGNRRGFQVPLQDVRLLRPRRRQRREEHPLRVRERCGPPRLSAPLPADRPRAERCRDGRLLSTSRIRRDAPCVRRTQGKISARMHGPFLWERPKLQATCCGS